jgi:hypothetical protein
MGNSPPPPKSKLCVERFTLGLQIEVPLGQPIELDTFLSMLQDTVLDIQIILSRIGVVTI